VEDVESAWYEMCIATTMREGGVIPYGCVVTSGVGDGLYECFIARAEGRIVGIALDFGLGAPADDQVRQAVAARHRAPASSVLFVFHL
jgi:hypothetical protein